MSVLLGLHDWLGLNDAIRYARHIGLEADFSDFLRTYTFFEFPLKINCKDAEIYALKLSDGQKSYPHTIYPYENSSIEKFESENGSFIYLNNTVDVTGPLYQFAYGLNDGVFVRVILGGLDDFINDRYQTVPVYLMDTSWDGDSHRLCFKLIKLENFLSVTYQDFLLLSRIHIEKLVHRALGHPDPISDDSSISQPVPVPAFSNSDHESYPPELHAAQLLWEGLYIKGEKNPHHPHQQAATLWLEKNKDTLPTSELANAGSEAMIKRLVTITTPASKKAKK